MFQCYDIKLSGLKRKYEMNDDMEIFDKINNCRNKNYKNGKFYK